VADGRNALTPEALAMMDTIARSGSFAAAARELGKVPSALTYSVRQLEDALDVLLFDRSSRQAQLTAAGEELLREGRRLLQEIDAVANRVRRVACGWETQLTIAADGIVSRPTLFELIDAFYAQRPEGLDGPPTTRLRLRTEVLAGTWEALVSGEADLAIGVSGEFPNPGGLEVRAYGEMRFVFCVAPHHPLAALPEPIGDDVLAGQRAIAVSDTATRMQPLTLNLLPGQDVLTVPSNEAKIEALIRGLGCAFAPEPTVRAQIEAGRLVERRTARGERNFTQHYAWRSERQAIQGRALQWWLEQLESPATRRALIDRHAGTLLIA
jgi:DNA-binding transcriptional LysR family regulator